MKYQLNYSGPCETGLKHKIKIHGGNHVKIKDVSLGIANNPLMWLN